MNKNLSVSNLGITFRRFCRKSYAVFCSIGKEIRIGVLALTTLTFANVGCFATSTTEQSNNGLFSSKNSDDEYPPEAEIGLLEGDLLFEIDNSGQANAVTQVTSGIDGLKISHVAIVVEQSQKIYALEAVNLGVVLTPLHSFIERQFHTQNKPCIAVSRLVDTTGVHTFVEKAMTQLGKPYDVWFRPQNNAFYCSELVYESYVNDDGSHIFDALSMTFKDSTGNVAPLWQKHFDKLGTSVPEGEIGTNPGDLSKSKNIKIVKFIY